jgi:regulator of sigma E protease
MGFLSSPLSIVLVVLALGILIIVHEGGHYLLARLSGMRVDRFSIGFGPQLISFKRGETIYQIAAIPLGGYVQIAGLTPGEDVGRERDPMLDAQGKEPANESDPRLYNNRPVWQRLLTIFAGPGTNYLFAAILTVIGYLAFGVPVVGHTPLIDMVEDNRPAAAAGMQPGDELISIDGHALSEHGQVAPLINGSQGKPVTIELRREGQPKTIVVTPQKIDGEYRVGIRIGAKEEFVKQPFTTCVAEGLKWPYVFTVETILPSFAKIRLHNLSGPLGIGKAMMHAFKLGLRTSLFMVAAISVYLGLFNLLPLPALDGGRLVFLAVEAISRRRVNQRIEQTVHMVGMFALLGLLLYVSFANDLGLAKLFHH